MVNGIRGGVGTALESLLKSKIAYYYIVLDGVLNMDIFFGETVAVAAGC